MKYIIIDDSKGGGTRSMCSSRIMIKVSLYYLSL